MAKDDDLFPLSLPIYQSPPHVFDADMTEAVNNGQHEFYNSPDYFFDTKANADFTDFAHGKTTADPSALVAQPSQGSPQDSSGESQRSSLDSSDGSSADAIMEDGGRVTGCIAIPADPSNEPTTDRIRTNTTSFRDDLAMGNDFFDFETAGSSPTQVSRDVTSNPIRMAIRSAPNHGMPPFGYGQFSGVFSHQSSCEGSPLSTAPNTNRQLHSRQSSGSQPQYIPGSFLEIQPQTTTNFQAPAQPLPPAQYKSRLSEKAQVLPELHISNLPKTQRVETQMHMRLTIWPLPEGVNKLHFQSYTMARTKLVIKPPPEKTPSMLELHAHCVCATAMEDPQKLKEAFERAAETAGREDSETENEGSSSRSLNMSDDDPRKPKNGGFVFICDQCIRRETKRIARKKLKNDEDEESWLEAQPKRIIVFNKAEIMDWQPWSSYHDDEETEEGNPRVSAGYPHFPDNAMQIRFPMRIQCYSRHHEEKLGYKVIFTIKDWKNRLVAQTITNAAIITDDHKAQQSSKNGAQTQSANNLESSNLPVAGIFSPQASSGSHGLPLINRNSFSTPDLQSLQRPGYNQMQPHCFPTTTFGGPIYANQVATSSRNASRPASPSTPLESQNKRRKGSNSGRIRSDLTMTKIKPTTSTCPTMFGGAPSGPNFAPEFGGYPPFTPNYPPPHGLTTPPTSAHAKIRSPATTAFNNNLFQRSQSVEDFQSYQNVFSTPTSAYQSQVVSPDSSPQRLSQPQLHTQRFTNSLQYIPGVTNPRSTPRVHKVTPAEGPKAGGIEVTCLGEGFRVNSVVTFGDMPASTISLYSDKALLCRLPPAAQAGLVRVTVTNTNDQNMPSPPQNEIYFRYIDNDEQEMIRHALQVLNQQFAGGAAEAPEFARHILATMGSSSSFNGGASSSNVQQRQISASSGNSRAFESLEDMTLRCLEIVDLDESPNQVNLNSRDANGHCMLHAAASIGYYRLVAGLLARGANPDLRDRNGMTPTHMACLNSHTHIIRKLRSAGADSTIRSLNGIRPTDLAMSAKARKAVEDLGFHAPSQSVGTTPSTQLSRASSTRSARSYRGMNRQKKSHGVQSLSDSGLSDDEDPVLYRSQPTTPVQAWSRSRRGSLAASAHLSKSTTEDKLSKDAEVFAASPAMSAWRDHISAQIQQLQQSVHRALPPIPNLPDYQANPVVRRISNLVPQRSPRADATDTSCAKLKETDYRWWELITGTASSPPAYEEIYPDKVEKQRDDKGPSALRAVAEAIADRKCETLYEQPQKFSTKAPVHIDHDGVAKHHQQEFMDAHARKVKKLRSDRNLFFIWILLLLLIMMAMMRDRAPQIRGITRQATTSFLDNGVSERGREAA